MKKVMISQPMAGKTEEEIKTTRDRAIKKLNELGYEVVNTLFTDEWVAKEKSNDVVNVPLWFLAKSLQKMSECDAVYFCKGWEIHEVVKLNMMLPNCMNLNLFTNEKISNFTYTGINSSNSFTYFSTYIYVCLEWGNTLYS